MFWEFMRVFKEAVRSLPHSKSCKVTFMLISQKSETWNCKKNNLNFAPIIVEKSSHIHWVFQMQCEGVTQSVHYAASHDSQILTSTGVLIVFPEKQRSEAFW